MPMSSGGRAARSSECVTSPKAREIGLTGCIVPIQYSLLIGRYVMAMAEHREPCDSRGSCTVLGAPEGEIPPGDSTNTSVERSRHVGFTPDSGRIAERQEPTLRSRSGHPTDSILIGQRELFSSDFA